MRKIMFLVGLILTSIGASFIVIPNSLAQENVKFIQDITAGLTYPQDVAVSQEGDIYAVDSQNQSVSLYSPEGDFKKFWGQEGQGPGQFRAPQSLAVTSGGKVLVADTGNNRIQVFNKIGEFLFSFGTAGSANGQFRNPVAVVSDQFGFTFVADRDNKRIQIFSPNGLFLNAFSTDFRPIDLGIDPQRNLYVLMPDDQKITKFSAEGDILQHIRCPSDGQNCLSKASAITVDAQGDIYLVDRAAQGIKKIDKNERLLISFGSQGNGRGQFESPSGIFVDENGNLYIADSVNKRIQILKVYGSEKARLTPTEKSPLILDFEALIESKAHIVDLEAIPNKGLFALSDQPPFVSVQINTNLEFGQEGKTPGDFDNPSAFYASLDNKIWVADTANHRIQIFTMDGTLSYQFGTFGKKPGQFNLPSGIALDNNGHIFVSDTRNNRIQKFTYDGIYIDSFGPDLINQSVRKQDNYQLSSPQDIVINSKNEIFIIDSNRSRIVVVDENGVLKRLIGGERGEAPGQFDNAVNLALDENDNLYVVDQGNYRIQMFDSRGIFKMTFGSPGKGGGYFQEVSALAVSEGKIYVADYPSNRIQVFRFSQQFLDKQNRIYATKAIEPPEEFEGNPLAKIATAKKTALDEAVKEIAELLNVTSEEIIKNIRIESIEQLNDNRIKVTVSALKNAGKSPKNLLKKHLEMSEK